MLSVEFETVTDSGIGEFIGWTREGYAQWCREDFLRRCGSWCPVWQIRRERIMSVAISCCPVAVSYPVYDTTDANMVLGTKYQE
jgi:hypothetical protein